MAFRLLRRHLGPYLTHSSRVKIVATTAIAMVGASLYGFDKEPKLIPALAPVYCADSPYLSKNFVADAAEIASPSVVNIVSHIKGGFFHGQSSGSGFIINRDGYIVTNAHVVAKAEGGNVTVTLWHGARKRTGIVHSLDMASDIALVRLTDMQPGEDLPIAKIGSSSSLRAGEFVVALGSPLHLQNSITSGIVSATARHSSELGMQSQARTEYIQTDAAINVGNSGGPLVNLDGEVVGINSMKAQGSDGISFAIPIDTALQIIDQLMKRRKVVRPYLGLKVANYEISTNGSATRRNRRDTIKESGDETQVYVVDVERGSPAAQAGLRPGDVIIEINNNPVRGVRAFLEVVGYEANKTLYLRLNRNGDIIDLEVTTKAKA